MFKRALALHYNLLAFGDTAEDFGVVVIGKPEFDNSPLRRAVRSLSKIDALPAKLEPDAERVETVDRMVADPPDLSGAWSSLYCKPDGGDR